MISVKAFAPTWRPSRASEDVSSNLIGLIWTHTIIVGESIKLKTHIGIYYKMFYIHMQAGFQLYVPYTDFVHLFLWWLQ